jgi:hypothetical protein
MNAAYTSRGPNNVGDGTDLSGHATRDDTTEEPDGYGSCQSRGRQERAHRSLENPQSRFPTAPTSYHHHWKCEVTAR